ncbi:MAG: T9SS type A sorting domain-containing protein [Bacteroidota bacterium]
MRRAHIIASLLFCTLCCGTSFIQAQGSEEIMGLKQFDSQIYFEQNLGQFDSRIFYQAHLDHAQMRFMQFGPSHAMVRERKKPNITTPLPKYENYRWMGEQESEYEALVWNVRFARSSPLAQIAGRKAMPGQINYFMGNDSSKWVRGAERFQELWYEDLYPGIDLRYYGTAQQEIKYDLIVKAKADPKRIQMYLEGTKGYQINTEGELEIFTQWGIVKDAAPYAYQYIDGQEIEIPVSYKALDEQTIGFQVNGRYDHNYPLIIDPVTLNWATYMHSSGSDDYIMATTLDTDQYVYVTGYTKSLTFPTTPGVYQDAYGGGIDAYVAKLTPQGNSLVYATYIGGYDWELAYGIGLNAKKEVFIAGFLRSNDYPTTLGSVQPTSGGGLVEGFVSCLSINGDNLIYSTYFGGSDRDYLYDMRVNALGEAYITGYTLSSDFPVTAGTLQTSIDSNGDAFVSKLSADGSSVLQSTFLGGSNYDLANGMDLRPNGEVYVVGNTGSTDYPVTAGVLQPNMSTTSASVVEDAFITRLSADFSSAIYSTYLGGSDTDGAYCVSVNSLGEAFISGVTYSNDLSTSVGAFQTPANATLGNGDAFVARIASDGSALNYLSYLGGNNVEFGKAIAVNADDEVFVLGATRSTNFPLSAGSNALNGMYDLFVTSILPDGTGMGQSSLLGGQYNDYPRAAGSLHLRDNNRLTIAATTHSADIPLTAGTYQSNKTNGLSDTPWIANVEFGTVLPAEISSLNANWDDYVQGVELSWFSFAEREMLWYAIERLVPDQGWQEIGQLIGNAQANEQLYTYLDYNAQTYGEATLYYRLKYTGVDGIDYYSRMTEVEVPLSRERQFLLRPNPAKDFVQISFLNESGQDYKWEVLDVEGRKVSVPSLAGLGQSDHSSIVLDLQALTAGIYLVRITDQDGHSQSEKLLVR